MMFHYPNIKWTRLQAEAIGINQEMVTLPSVSDEMNILERSLKTVRDKDRIQGIVTGALASDYQKTRIDRICDGLNLKTYSPVWHKSSQRLVEDLHQNRFNIIMSRVAANGLDSSWLGHVLAGNEWDKLRKLSTKYSFNLTGEGGEYETFVVDAPHFNKRIEIEKGHVETEGDATTFIIDSAVLREKA
jgi:asparagine synthase (glutamine-hydrolysing)